VLHTYETLNLFLLLYFYSGCIGSSDATHIVHEKCSSRLKNSHLGLKSTMATKVFNVVVNHRRRILNTTVGLPGRWNGKTVVLFDNMLGGIHLGELYANIKFKLNDRDGSTHCYSGVYVIVDNVYHRWPVTVPPYTDTTSMDEFRWSKWVESMQKDVECTFGILEGRWRILKTGIRLHKSEAVTQVWKTCCALHDWLLEVDGLNERWMNGIRSDYKGELGLHDIEDMDRMIPLVLALGGMRGNTTKNEISTIVGDRGVDLSSIGTRQDGIAWLPTEMGEVTLTHPNTINVRSMMLHVFCERLVLHFMSKWLKNEIQWPSRTGTVEWTLSIL
jgi:hypothetical protein